MSSFLALTSALLLGSPQVVQQWDFVQTAELAMFTKTAITGGDAALTAAHGGVLRFTGAATTDDTGAQIQVTTACIDLAPGMTFTEVARVRVNDAPPMFQFGISTVDASIVASDPVDGIWLVKADAAATMSLVVRRDSVSVTVALDDTVDEDDWQTWGIQVRCTAAQKATIVVYLNGSPVYEGKFVNVPDDATLSPFFAMQSGSAVGTQTVDLDYLSVTCDR